jgi:hypothetical protein
MRFVTVEEELVMPLKPAFATAVRQFIRPRIDTAAMPR